MTSKKVARIRLPRERLLESEAGTGEATDNAYVISAPRRFLTLG